MSKTRHTQFLRFAITLSAALAAFSLVHATAFAESNPLQEQIEAIQESAADLADAARERSQPIPEGEVKLLKAVVMAVKGRAEWRTSAEEASWSAAKVDDVIDAGAMIRTGRNASVTLRVGQNATVLVDRNTRLVLPEIVQSGETLRTTVGLPHGRADFKVDRVGLTNDFSVVTPSATLAVQGTGYAVSYGGFDGTEIAASRLNEMYAIEVRYFMNLFTYHLSGGATSADRNRDPVIAELFNTIGPSALIAAIIEADATPEMLANTLLMNPIREGRRVDASISGLRNTLASPLFIPPPRFDRTQFGFARNITLTDAEVAEFTCLNLRLVFARYADLLLEDGLGTGGILLPQNDLRLLCLNTNDFQDAHLQEIVETIIAYCQDQYNSPADITDCINDFGIAVTQELRRSN